MKKLFYFTLLFTLCLGFTACGDDKENEPIIEPEKPFVWNGDWNDPNDPNYKKDGYNPIRGDWHSQDDLNMRIIFTSDFVMNIAFYDKIYKKWNVNQFSTDKYIINDNGIRYIRNISQHTEEYKIIKENGEEVLMMRYQFPADKEWQRYKRYKE
ncbi:hypothetical protein [Dysgonomonas sp. ZJ709]|uniref:hypothetical protein n=1 Tax=Dysgonomonas sp. ZJ709 TaxID=2709797 RepID=UPI0013EA9188|nr:hypothetical protein [Dysgonomonas sp. ZJ709]